MAPATIGARTDIPRLEHRISCYLPKPCPDELHTTMLNPATGLCPLFSGTSIQPAQYGIMNGYYNDV